MPAVLWTVFTLIRSIMPVRQGTSVSSRHSFVPRSFALLLHRLVSPEKNLQLHSSRAMHLL